MGETAELVAERYGISRKEMDDFSIGSHRKAIAAMKAGNFKDELVSVEIKGRKGEVTVVDKDEGPREDATPEALARLKPVFRKENGVVTPGNASTINDGAAAVVLMSGRKVKQTGTKPLARIVGYASGGLEPKWVMMAPMEAVKNLSAKTGLRLQEMDLIEINEAFAVQTCALIKELKLDPAKVNVNGGAVALGHPIGCSGARVLVTLVHALRQRKLRRGVATLCLGGGNAVAMAIEVV
jgi:acetyl-CoA C-acetyltransferase